MKGVFAVKPKKDVVFYNILFPVWMMIFIPSLLWLLLFPANYLIDHLSSTFQIRTFQNAGSSVKRTSGKYVWLDLAVILQGRWCCLYSDHLRKSNGSKQ